MTEGKIQGKWFCVQNNGEFKKAEFELAGSNRIHGQSYLIGCKETNNALVS